MTDKELRRLRRDDLLQILLTQQRQIDEMTAQAQRNEAALADRNIAIEEAGSVAEASLRLNGVFEAAQSAADQYREQMTQRADALVAEAEKKSEEARRLADELVRNARAEADRIISQARRDAEALVREAGGAPVRPEPVETQAEAEEGEKRRRGFLWRNKKS